jgi:predicted alpha/beta-hydrolase family hydrolase
MDELRVLTDAGAVTASLLGSGDRMLVLGHGAGGNRGNPFLLRFARALADTGRGVVLFNFPYSEQRRRLPDPPAVLEATVRAVAAEARRRGARRLVLGGKSLGGRIASQAAARGLACDALVFLGYPLHPRGRTDKLRDTHLPGVGAPMLFLQGTRDALARLDLIEAVTARLGGAATLVRFEQADHSFAVPRRSGHSATDVEARLVSETLLWLSARGL